MSQDVTWTFLTNHAHVVLTLAANPEMTIRGLSLEVGITERAVQSILNDLVDSGYVGRERVGRQNRYQLLLDRPLRHHVEAHRSLGDLVRMVFGSRKRRSTVVRIP